MKWKLFRWQVCREVVWRARARWSEEIQVFALRWFELLWQGYFAIVCTQERLCEAVVEGRYFLKGDMFAFVFFFIFICICICIHICVYICTCISSENICVCLFLYPSLSPDCLTRFQQDISFSLHIEPWPWSWSLLRDSNKLVKPRRTQR